MSPLDNSQGARARLSDDLRRNFILPIDDSFASGAGALDCANGDDAAGEIPGAARRARRIDHRIVRLEDGRSPAEVTCGAPLV